MVFKSLLIRLAVVVVVFRTVTLMAGTSQSYHGAEGMPQEDGVSIQKSLVPAALCCL